MSRERPFVGIVLAGGRSSRFGRDKLAETVDGEPLLWRPVRALAAAGCSEIVLVIPPTGAKPPIPPDVATPIRRVRDAEAFGGPLSGARAGLAAVTAGGEDPVVVLVAGDQPSLVPSVLRELVGQLDAGHRAAVLVDAAGRTRPLPMALAASPALRAAVRLLEDGERRLRALSEVLDAAVVPLDAWSRLDPSGATLIDIDQPTDLPEPRPARPPSPS